MKIDWLIARLGYTVACTMFYGFAIFFLLRLAIPMQRDSYLFYGLFMILVPLFWLMSGKWQAQQMDRVARAAAGEKLPHFLHDNLKAIGRFFGRFVGMRREF